MFASHSIQSDVTRKNKMNVRKLVTITSKLLSKGFEP